MAVTLLEPVIPGDGLASVVVILLVPGSLNVTLMAVLVPPLKLIAEPEVGSPEPVQDEPELFVQDQSIVGEPEYQVTTLPAASSAVRVTEVVAPR